jgi:hypothetical protein
MNYKKIPSSIPGCPETKRVLGADEIQNLPLGLSLTDPKTGWRYVVVIWRADDGTVSRVLRSVMENDKFGNYLNAESPIIPDLIPDLPTTGLAFCWMQNEIAADMKSGIVPETVASFSELHDYVDANCYGGAEFEFIRTDGTDESESAARDAIDDVYAPAMERVNDWLAQRAKLRQLLAARDSADCAYA